MTRTSETKIVVVKHRHFDAPMPYPDDPTAERTPRVILGAPCGVVDISDMRTPAYRMPITA